MTLTILTLNLHSYQEIKRPGDTLADQVKNHEPLILRIAAAIEELDVDLVCLQEVAEAGTEPITTPYGQTPSNAAWRIHKQIDNGQRYSIRQDWSHYAWDTWREGVAIMSKFPIRRSASRYTSTSRSKNYWKSRNILMAQIDHPQAGLTNIFSVHSGWWDDEEEPAQEQFDRLRAWVAAEQSEDVSASFLCGDFNSAAAGPGYTFWTASGSYSDQYLAANPQGMYDPTIGGQVDGWEGESSGQRIDYIFMKKGSPYRVQEARTVFTPLDYGRVSDHAGVFAAFAAIGT